jgi:hypothetical protein
MLTHPLLDSTTDLCNTCVEKRIVFPSLAAFEEGVNLPAIYVIFYNYFVKSSVGDNAWKVACLDAEDQSSPIVPPQGEAFAMLLLKNNYFAWLWEAKMKLGNLLITDYDTTTEDGVESAGEIADVVLKCQIDMDVQADEQDWNKILVKPTVNHRKYESLRKATNARLKTLRHSARNSDKYKEFKSALDEGSEEESTDVDLESRTKKRKRLKAFREYTNPKDAEGKFKGWSMRAASDMRDSIQLLGIVNAKDKLFRRVYRHIYRENKGNAGKKKIATEEAPPENYEVEMWALTAKTTVRL